MTQIQTLTEIVIQNALCIGTFNGRDIEHEQQNTHEVE